MKDKSEALAGRHSNGGSVVMISDEAFKRIHARLQKPFVKRVAKSATLAQRQHVPEGWQLVPKVPTPEMISAAVEKGCGRIAAVMIYRAMLAAAPAAQAEPQEPLRGIGKQEGK